MSISNDESSSDGESFRIPSSKEGADEKGAKGENPGVLHDVDGGEGVDITVNQKYAKDYNQRKRREELTNHKKSIRFDDNVQERYFDDDSSASSSEDEDAELLTPQVDLQILKTINAIRHGEAAVYNPDVVFFKEYSYGEREVEDQDVGTGSKRQKKKRFKDVLREQILEEVNKPNDAAQARIRGDEDGDHRLAYDEEQRAIRKDFLKSFHDNEGEEMCNRTRSDDELAASDDEDWLIKKTQNKEPSPNQDELESLRKKFASFKKDETERGDLLDPKEEIQDGEAFLRDFILERKWLDKSNLENEDGSSDGEDSDVVDVQTPLGNSSHVEQERKLRVIGDVNDDDSLEELDRMDAFESKYNFRFEENSEVGENNETAQSSVRRGTEVVSYGRGLGGDLLRRPDEKRKKKRELRKERKLAERKAKEEQLRRLRNAKREELQDKLEQIQAVSGILKKDKNAKGRLDEEALAKLMEEDFDPDKFSSAMEGLYGDDFYEEEEGQWKTETDVKESMKSDKELVDAGTDDFYDHEVENGHGQGVDLEEDDSAYYDEAGEEEEVDYAAADGQAIETEEESEVEKKLKEKMQEELYKLDYEDIIAGMPCRFKYRQVEANSYGLSCEEVLLAKDSTLKDFVSLKKMTPYREDVSALVNECPVPYKPPLFIQIFSHPTHPRLSPPLPGRVSCQLQKETEV
jgi:protein KRI1